MMGKKDICMKVTTETLENIKILKLYNWENEFKKKILEARSVEMDYTDKRYIERNLAIHLLSLLAPMGQQAPQGEVGGKV